MAEQRLTDRLDHEIATASLGAALAAGLRPGDLVFLTGEMGAGKTALARAIIRALTSADTHVPSPTFTLVCPYEEARKPLWHADLFRLNAPEELYELGLIEARDDHIILVEWPQRAEGFLGDADIYIDLDQLGDRTRGVTLSCENEERFQSFAYLWGRHQARMNFLQNNISVDRPDIGLDPITGDASARAYLRVYWPDQSAGPKITKSGEPTAETSKILMDWPQGPDGPAIYDGQSYSRRARLAEQLCDFTNMVAWLGARGFSAPSIEAENATSGHILLEDLGSTSCVDLIGTPAHQHFYFEAVAVLSALHACPLAAHLASYDADVLTFETELFLDWYLPAHEQTVSDSARQAWRDIWAALCAAQLKLPAVTVLRDYHSPNLLWLSDRQSHHRIGLIDVQDALAGSPAYDLMSLLLDARIDVSAEIRINGLDQYCRQAFADDAAQRHQFEAEFWLLGLQRNLKIAGIFHRLAVRDGKPAYLKHMPRIEAYLRQSLEGSESLVPIKNWLTTHAAKVPWLD